MSPHIESVPESAAVPTDREMVRIEHVTKQFSLRHDHSLKELVFSALQRKKLAEQAAAEAARAAAQAQAADRAKINRGKSFEKNNPVGS